MSPLIRLLLIAQAVDFVAFYAHGQSVRDYVLDDHAVYSVPVSGTRVTTVSFPSPIAAIDGALITMDGKTPGAFQIAHTKGTAFLSVRALAKGATSMMEVPLVGGVNYFIAGACDEDCSDLDLRIFAADNTTPVAEDTAEDDAPMLNFKAPRSGRYMLAVDMAECKESMCYYGYRVYRK